MTEPVYQWREDDRRGYANAMGRYKTAMELAFVRKHLSPSAHTVLDIGGGSGRMALPLAREGRRITVIDPSHEAALLLASAAHPDVRTVCADFVAVELDEAFDGAIAIESVQYFIGMELERLFAKVRKLLVPGGVFIFTELNARSWRHHIHRLRRSSRREYNVATPSEYGRALARAGLELIEMRGFLWMPFPVTSDSPAVSAFAAIEQGLGLWRWTDQSPWLLIAARRSR